MLQFVFLTAILLCPSPPTHHVKEIGNFGSSTWVRKNLICFSKKVPKYDTIMSLDEKYHYVLNVFSAVNRNDHKKEMSVCGSEHLFFM